MPLASTYILPIARVSKVFIRNLHHHQDPNFCVCQDYLQYCFNLFAERESFSIGLHSWMLCVQWVIGHLVLFLLSEISISTLENMIFLFLFLLSKLEIRISNFSFYSRNSRSEFQNSPSTLEIREQNLKFLFLLSKFEIRILNFSFYSRIYFFDSRQCLSEMRVIEWTELFKWVHVLQ